MPYPVLSHSLGCLLAEIHPDVQSCRTPIKRFFQP